MGNLDTHNNLFSKNILGIAYVTENLYIIKANQYLEKILGYKRHELNGVSIRSIAYNNYELTERLYMLSKAKEFVSPFIREYISKDGTHVFALVTIRSIFDKDGNFEYFVFSAFDYMPYFLDMDKNKNHVPIMSFNNVSCGIFFKDINFRYVLVNQIYLDNNYLDSQDIIGKLDDDIFSKKLALTFRRQEIEVLQSSKSVQFESVSFIDKKQQKTKTALQTIYDLSGNPIGILGIIYDDFSYEVRTRRKLIESVFANSLEGVIVTDEFEYILAVNPSATKMLGFEESELIGKKPSTFSSGKHSKKFYDNMWNNIHQSGFWHGEIVNKHKNGENILETLTISEVKDEHGKVIHYIGTFFDMEQVVKMRKELDHNSAKDELTGLPNRFYLELNTKQQLLEITQKSVGFIYFDLDNFKNINDAFGHSVGDDVIVQVSKRLKKVICKNCTILRMGGDEFMFIVYELPTKNRESKRCLNKIIDDIFDVFKDPFMVKNNFYNITCSIGASIYPRDGYDIDTLVKNADTAMYQAKKDGKNTYCFYKSTITKDLMDKIETETSMRKALQNDEFFVLYQPQFDMESGKIIGVEALARWEHPIIGIIPPDKFIPIAEENNLISKIGDIVLNLVCKDIKRWIDLGYDLEGFKVAINVSAVQLINENIYRKIKEISSFYNISPTYLKIELTETAVMENYSDAEELLLKLDRLGVDLSIDDFGTGYSSFAYLNRFSVKQIKIDKSFVENIPTNKDNVAIVKAILALGKSMRIEVIAEGLENDIQRDFLLKEGCKKAQGYLYSKPIHVDMLEKKYLSND